MLAALVSTGSSTVLLGGSYLLSFFFKKKSVTKNVITYAPCVTTQGPNADIVLPQANRECPKVQEKYEYVYLSPENNPMINSFIDIYNYSNQPKMTTQLLPYDPRNVLFSFHSASSIQTAYCPMRANVSTIIEPNVFGPLTASKQLVNMCPQSFVKNAFLAASDFASSLALPLSTPINETPMAWIIPGLGESAPGLNGINAPSNYASVQNGSTVTTSGLATELYMIANKDVSFYMELTGAYGGSVQIYSNGVDPGTGKPLSVKSYEGGSPGVVFGLYSMKQFDVLKIFLGSPGDDSTQWLKPSIFSYDGNGQGGLGTMFGGTNGGGASYAAHYDHVSFGKALPEFDKVLQAALNNEPGFSLVCVAGGGGGASRNASGGAAGLSNNDLKFGSKNLSSSGKPVSESGSTGSSLNTPGPSAIHITKNTLDLSGGGGSHTIGGSSNVPNPTSEHSCYGQRLRPFEGNTATSSGSGGGCATATNVGSGGGGGGGGYYGGGSGGWNNKTKPNNLHGAGGGGSSFQGLLRSTSTSGNINLNAFRTLNVQQTRYGSLVLGIAQ